MPLTNRGCEGDITPRSRGKTRANYKFLETDTNLDMFLEKLKQFLIITINTTAIPLENENHYEDVCREDVDPPMGIEPSGE